MAAKKIILITGGARSGKSCTAEQIAASFGGPVQYIATMLPSLNDPESIARIKEHKGRRPADWNTIEAPAGVDDTVVKLPKEAGVVIIDCLTLLVSNILFDESAQGQLPANFEDEVLTKIEKLLAAMDSRSDLVFVVVTSEVGGGVVPDNKLARMFRDCLGKVNQRVAELADDVILMCAGQRLRIKG